jgi:signal transduction histidine kinase
MAMVVLLRRHVSRVRAAERRARAAERMAEIGAMTGGLAHEIKNPLSTIGLNAQLLVEGLEDTEMSPDDRSRLLNRSRALARETDRLRGILSDFLEFAGQVHLERRVADVNELVVELCDFYQPEAERQGVKLRVQTHREQLRAMIDTRLVKQAVLNLMINATQAMSAMCEVRTGQDGKPPECDLILRTEPAREPDGTRTVAIHVIDTGPGMDGATLERIFKPYFTTKSGGSGLGLPTSRRLIEEHGGRIGVHSEPGKGSDFSVVLPVGPVVPGPVAKAPSVTSGASATSAGSAA